jgi:hypothetical protein
MISRRSFFHRSGKFGAALAAPYLMTARKGMAQGPLVVGEGEYRFECLHDWGTLPAGHNYGGATHGVAVDAAGHVYITHHGTPASVFVFDPAGKFVRALGEIHAGTGHGIEIRKEGGEEFLYLTSDGDNGFAKLTLKGEVVWQRNAPPESGKYDGIKGYRNTNLSFTPDGGFHVGDGYGSHYIHRYDKDANYICTFGGKGAEPGKFQTPHGQILDDRDGTPKLLVADRANKRLQYFTLDGQFLSVVDGLLFPADIDIGAKGELLVSDLHARLTIFDKKNNVITHLGDDPEWRAKVLDGLKMRSAAKRPEWRPGRFVHPHDAKFLANGDIVCAEWVDGGRVTYLKRVA